MRIALPVGDRPLYMYRYSGTVGTTHANTCSYTVHIIVILRSAYGVPIECT